MDHEQISQKLFKVFNPFESLTPDDPRYVECNQVRGSTRLLNTLARVVKLAGTPTSQLLSGHRGSGKTTELQRLKQQLSEDAVYYVVYCDAEDLLDLKGTVEYTDVMRAILQRVCEEAETHSISVASNRLITFLQNLGSTSVQVTSGQIGPSLSAGSLKLALGQLNFNLKRNAEHRDEVANFLRAKTDTFMDVVNEAIEKATAGFRASDANCQGIVVIVDNLDRVLPTLATGQSHNNHDELFIHAATQMTALACHVIYSLPPELRYSANGAKLTSLYGNQVQMLPMIPVKKRSAEEHAEGQQILMEMIAQRLQLAGKGAAFEDEKTIERLCAISGGYVRQLMTLTRNTVINSGTLPLTSTALEEAIIDLRNNTIPGIRRYLPTLPKIADTNSLDEINESADYLQLLNSHAILEYLDEDGYWYDVNPIIREAKEFST
jgi:hypothetical protein